MGTDSGEPLGDEAFYASKDPSQYLLVRGSFERFVRLEYERAAYVHGADVDFCEDKHDFQIAFERYVSLYKAFRLALERESGGAARPNQFKIAAALCFSLRRMRPIASIRPSLAFVRRIAEGRVHGVIDAGMRGDEAINGPFLAFYQFADEICAFETGLRIAQHLTAQSLLNGVDASADLIARAFAACRPRIARYDMIDILVTLRDHATSPYSLLVLYAACFSRPPQQPV